MQEARGALALGARAPQTAHAHKTERIIEEEEEGVMSQTGLMPFVSPLQFTGAKHLGGKNEKKKKPQYLTTDNHRGFRQVLFFIKSNGSFMK